MERQDVTKRMYNDLTVVTEKRKLYEAFNGTLESISGELGLVNFTIIDNVYNSREDEVERTYEEITCYGVKLNKLMNDDRMLANYLLGLLMRTHAMIGEKSFMIEQGIDYYTREEEQIKERIKCYRDSTQFEKFMNEPAVNRHEYEMEPLNENEE